MNWREAFLKQAKCDAAILGKMNSPDIAYSQRLHYVQMLAEKLAKGFLHPQGSQDPPQPTHAGLIKMLRMIKGVSYIRRQLGYANRESFHQFVESILPIAQQVQSLAPSIAGFSQPNPEYPWRPLRGREVIVPCEYKFDEFDPKRPQMANLVRFLNNLAFIAE